MLPTEPSEPSDLILPPYARSRGLGEREVAEGVPPPQFVLLAALVEPLQGVLPDRLEHPVARYHLEARLRRYQRLLDQVSQ